MKDGPEANQAAQQKITEGMELLKSRQTLIKLADSSKHGWRVVEQYESHQLAEDSDDKKRIFKAEARCDRLLKEEMVKKDIASR